MNKSRDVREFWCCWFTERQEWRVLLDNGDCLGPFPAVMYAVNAALRDTGRAESEWNCSYVGQEMQHFEADESNWRE